eukprot:CAMPEP_0185025166 /NCGR_PEP_ID=MMETSP1103-20130426/8229_1 /TAXON_ID=36769 /ORGANISM="Paraphysomonas bandaiensis, Strain Caron Lab Isolate" /LENGTH=191 /DNA_ID=CAMNT_0027558307 /DNA_START=33 /DNA_END=608 /DNA_ORIENTATION=-
MSNLAETMADCLQLQVECLQAQIKLLRNNAANQPNDSKDAGEDQKTKRKKAPVDPNKPKRNHSAYQLFIMEILPKLKQENPGMQQTDIMSLAASRWGKMDDSQKTKYVEAAAKDKMEYHLKLEQYNSGATPDVVSTPSSKAPASSQDASSGDDGEQSSHQKKKKKKDSKEKRRKSDAGSDSDHKKKKKKHS